MNTTAVADVPRCDHCGHETWPDGLERCMCGVVWCVSCVDDPEVEHKCDGRLTPAVNTLVDTIWSLIALGAFAVLVFVLWVVFG